MADDLMDGAIWRALMDGLPPREQRKTAQIVRAELRKQVRSGQPAERGSAQGEDAGTRTTPPSPEEDKA
jgi:hypothetical protein